MTVFSVMDFGAKGDGHTDDTVAIQKALDAAYAAGGGIVTLPAGTFIIHGTGDASDGGIRIRSNTELQGAGMGRTIVKLADGWSGKISGLIRTPPSGEQDHNIIIRNLSVDGNRAHTTGDVDGIMTGYLPNSTKFDYNILIDSVEVKNVSRIGFNPHEQTHDLTIRNSVSHDNGWDGFVGDYVSDTVYENNIAYNNGRHGFNIVTQSHDVILRDNVSYNNAQHGIVIQRGSEDRGPAYDILLQNNTSYGNGQAGIYMQRVVDGQVIGNHVYDNGEDGITLDSTTSNVVAGNLIENNSRAAPERFDAIHIQGYNGSFPGVSISTDNKVLDNRIVQSAIAGSNALAEDFAKSSGDVFAGNTYTGIFKDGALKIESSNLASSSGQSYSIMADPRTVEPGSWAPAAGTPPADSLLGTKLNDVIKGTAGNDLIQGFGGADAIDGGSGTDTATYAGSVVGVHVSLVTGLGSGGDAAGDTLVNIENLTGSNYNDVLDGNAGNNVLAGGAGADVLIGHQGNDTYVVDNVGDLVTENPGEGTDSVLSSISYSLGANVENLTLTGSDNIAGTGTAAANSIVGNSGDNSLAGLAGADTIDGGLGTDTASYAGSVVGVHVSLVTGLGSGGDATGDTLVNIENLGGSNFNDVLEGNAGNNVLSGGAGADVLIGHQGNDTYVVDNIGDLVTENPGEGTDSVLSSISYSLGANVENLTLTGSGNIAGTGNAAANNMVGNSGDNSLAGLAGADTIDGGSGADTATYAASPAGIHVSLLTGLGSGGDAAGDQLVNIENLTGSNFNDALEGNVGNNILAGGLGADVLTGGGGHDKFIFKSFSDSKPAAADRITDFVHGLDQIDLSMIDANSAIPGNQAFAFAGSSGSVVAHSITWQESGGNTIVKADVNGDTTADMVITLTGAGLHLTASDFIL